MRFQRILVLVVLAALLMPSSLVFGQEPIKASVSAFWDAMKRDTKRNHLWPKPFIKQARISTRAPLNVMVANGWRFQNMLGEYHFDEETGELTEAAKFRITRVLNENPMQHRSLYVSRADTPEATDSRMQMVYALAAKLAPDGEVPPIYETSATPDLTSGRRTNAIRTLADQAIQPPVLPAAQYTTD